MTGPLFTPERADGAALRHWGRQDAQRFAILVTRGTYPEAEAVRELAATLAWHAERAGIASVSCRELAASMVDDEVAVIENRLDDVLNRMTAAAERVLRHNPLDRRAAAHAAADISRAEDAPIGLIETAFRFALWRTRRRA
jgi:ferredoxin-thioredoxin reductase catalytic subunit